LGFFSADDRFTIVILQTLEHGFMCLALFLEFLLFVVQLVNNKLMFLLQDSFFLSPSLLGHLECVLSLLKLGFNILQLLAVEKLLVFLIILLGLEFLVVGLFE
jgi:hypothetical protein